MSELEDKIKDLENYYTIEIKQLPNDFINYI